MANPLFNKHYTLLACWLNETPFQWHPLRQTQVQTCLPKNTSVSAPNSLCPYFQISYQIFFLGGEGVGVGHTTTQNKSVKGQFFFNHLSCKNSVWTNIFNYIDALHTGILWHLGAFILFTSAKVVADQRPQNTSSKSNAPCVLMPTCPSLNGCCLVGACFLGLLHSSSSSSVPCSYSSPTDSHSNLPYLKMANFHKALNTKSMFTGFKKTTLTNQDQLYTSAPEMAWNKQM